MSQSENNSNGSSSTRIKDLKIPAMLARLFSTMIFINTSNSHYGEQMLETFKEEAAILVQRTYNLIFTFITVVAAGSSGKGSLPRVIPVALLIIFVLSHKLWH